MCWCWRWILVLECNVIKDNAVGRLKKCKTSIIAFAVWTNGSTRHWHYLRHIVRRQYLFLCMMLTNTAYICFLFYHTDNWISTDVCNLVLLWSEPPLYTIIVSQAVTITHTPNIKFRIQHQLPAIACIVITGNMNLRKCNTSWCHALEQNSGTVTVGYV